MYLNIFLAIVICTISKDQAEDEGRSKSTFSLKLQPSDHTTNERGVVTSDHVIEEEPPPPPPSLEVEGKEVLRLGGIPTVPKSVNNNNEEHDGNRLSEYLINERYFKGTHPKNLFCGSILSKVIQYVL